MSRDLYIYSGLNRTLCAVLDEMRKACKTSNYSYLPGLIEEAQSMGNKMEAALHDNKEAKDARKTIKEAKTQLIALKAEIKALEDLKKMIK